MKTNTVNVPAQGITVGFLISQAASLVGKLRTKMPFLNQIGHVGRRHAFAFKPCKIREEEVWTQL